MVIRAFDSMDGVIAQGLSHGMAVPGGDDDGVHTPYGI